MRHRRRTPAQLSIFPFLSVLCSVIGVLMLFMLIIVSTRAIVEAGGGRNVPSEFVAETLQPAGLGENEWKDWQEALRRLEHRLAQRRQDADRLRTKLTLLEELIAANREDAALPTSGPQQTGVSLEPSERIAPVPKDDFKVNKEPRYVEVLGDGFRRQPENRFHPLAELNDDGSDLAAFINSVDGRRNHEYLVFLIREDGYEPFFAMEQFLKMRYPRRVPSDAKSSRIDIGKEPFPRKWKFAKAPGGEAVNEE